MIEKSETSLHFGKAQTETQLTLAAGKHTLTLQFGDGGHIVLRAGAELDDHRRGKAVAGGDAGAAMSKAQTDLAPS